MQPFQVAALYAAEQPYDTTLKLGVDGFEIETKTQRNAINFGAVVGIPFDATADAIKAAIDDCIERVNVKIAMVENAEPHNPRMSLPGA